MAAAKEKAQRTQCENNCKQIGLATHMYVNEGALDNMPDPNWGQTARAGGARWLAGWLYALGPGNAVLDLWTPPFNADPVRAHETGLLWTYLKNISIYQCPLDKTNSSNFRLRANKFSTSVEDGAIVGYRKASASLRQSEFRADAYMLWEPNDVPQSYNDAASRPYDTEGLGTCHGKMGGVVLTCSGSVEFVKYAKWATLAASPDKNRFWCNPGTDSGHE